MTHRFLVACPLLCVLACATTRGTVPAPPTDGQLANDGTPGAQAALEKRYALRTSSNPLLLVAGMDTVEVGDARRPTTDGWLDLDAQGDVAAHLASDGIDVAGGLRPWRMVGFGAAIAMTGMGAAWLLGVVAFNLLVAGGMPGFDVATGAVVAGTVSSATFGLLVMGEAVAGAVLVASQAMVRATVRGQAARHNARLRERIRGNVMTVVPAPPPASTGGSEPLHVGQEGHGEQELELEAPEGHEVLVP